jgi:hypothetical protein
MRSAAVRGNATIVVGALTALGFGAGAAASPLALVAVIVVPIVLLVPIVAAAFAVLADGVAFPLLILGSTSTLINIGVLIAVLAALPAVLARRQANTLVLRVAALVFVLTLPGLLIAFFQLPTAQWLSGIRYIVVPLAVAVLGSTLSDRQLRLVLKGVTCLMVVAAIAAAIENSLGSDELLKLTKVGYGVSIRNIGSALRAPGTFATNYLLGAYASVVAVVALLWWGTLKDAKRDLGWRIVALASALAGLAFSTYRTGVILLAVSVGAAVFLSGPSIKAWVKVLVATIAGALVAGFLVIGLGNSDSFYERLAVWRGLLDSATSVLGNGLGYSGAASGAAGSAAQIFTDNYYISLWLQFGVAGAAIVVIFVGIFVALLVEGRRGNPRAAVAVALWAGTLVAFAFVELWEYTSAMSIIAMIVGASARGYRRSPAPAAAVAQAEAVSS